MRARQGQYWLWLCGLFAALLSTAQPVCATNFPVLSGKPVVDQAGILSADDEDQLNDKLLKIEQQSGHQVAVATIRSLQGIDIADYGLMLGRRWAIGRKGVDDGVMILVAPKDRKMRIEVGVGLEDTIPNGFAESVIEDAMKPKFRAGDMAGGINDAVDMVAEKFDVATTATDERLTHGYQEPAYIASANSAPDNSVQDRERPWPEKIGIAIVWFVFSLAVMLVVWLFFVMVSAIFSPSRRGWASGGGYVSNWNSVSSNVYVDASPTMISSSPPRHFSAPDPSPSYHSSSSSGGFSGGDGGRFRGGGASGSW